MGVGGLGGGGGAGWMGEDFAHSKLLNNFI